MRRVRDDSARGTGGEDDREYDSSPGFDSTVMRPSAVSTIPLTSPRPMPQWRSRAPLVEEVRLEAARQHRRSRRPGRCRLTLRQSGGFAFVHRQVRRR